MKTKVTLNAIKNCTAILFVSLGLLHVDVSNANAASEFELVDPNRIPEILNMILTQVRSNYERIKTWQGEKDVVIDYISRDNQAEKVFKNNTDGLGKIPRILRDRRECIIEFAVDIEKDLLHVNNYHKKPLQYIDLETGRDLGAKGIAGRARYIVTPEYYIHCRPNTMRDGTIISRKAVKKPREECPTCDGPSVFDPRELFGLPLQPVWVTFPRIIKVLDDRGEYGIDGYSLKVEERISGDITEYRIQKPGKLTLESGKFGPEYYLLLTMVFSSAKGFNIISEETTFADGKPFSSRKWDYELIDGIYLPIKTTRQSFRSDTARVEYESKGFLKNLKVNHPIPPETFTYKNLGLKDGDKFVDKILNKEYTYQAEKLIEVEKENK